MKPKFCQFVDQNIWRYIDRELSARKVSEISIHLKRCDTCNKLFESRAREASLYRLAFVETPFGDGFASRFEEDFLRDFEEPRSPGAGAEIFTFNPPMRHRRLFVVVSVAAMLLVVVIGGLLSTATRERFRAPPERSGQLLVDADADADSDGSPLGQFLNDSQSQVHVVDTVGPVQFRPGQTYSRSLLDPGGPPTPVEVELRDAKLVFSRDPWTLRVPPDVQPGGAFRAVLEEGEVDVSVRRRPADRPFVIETPNAVAEVVGTRFRLSVVRRDGFVLTELEVREGTVNFRTHDGEDDYVTVGSGRKKIDTRVVHGAAIGIDPAAPAIEVDAADGHATPHTDPLDIPVGVSPQDDEERSPDPR